MKKKLFVVFMTIAMAVSLVCGMSFMTASADEATEIAWPAEFSSADWTGATELKIPTNYEEFNNGPTLTFADGTLAKVTIKSGESTYTASHIYGWLNRLTFYFNETGYNGQNATKGDLLTVAPGFTVTAGGKEFA